MTKKYVVIYESADEVRQKAPLHFAEHQARWKQYGVRGELLMIGPFSDVSGSMAIFTSREAAEEFVKGDPFVVHGVVRSWQIKEWDEALS
jgi:uncharacterized protein YciI